MSHEVEQMVYFGQVPWHGLGNLMPDEARYDISKCMELAGLDFTVDLHPLYTEDGIAVSHRAVIRENDKAVYGVVGPQYTPLQNKDAFDWFQPLLDAQECQLHTAGSLYGGRKIWILAQINKENSTIVPGDEVSKFVLLSNSHDGTTSVRVGFTPIRVVCANTLAMSHQSAGSKLLRVRHSVNVLQNMENIRDIMNLANEEFEATAEQYRLLANRQICKSDLEKYVKVCLGMEEGELSTKSKNILDNVLVKFESGNQDLPGMRGSWWAAYNAVNEYMNYNQGRNANNRLNNLWFGTGTQQNNKSMQLALVMAG